MAPQARTESQTILVVDDDRAVQKIISMYLERVGFKVRCCSSVEDAEQLLQSELPEIVLLDVVLPGRSGLEFCLLLKDNPATAQIPIMLLSGNKDDADVTLGLDSGADDYIVKPFSTAVLLSRVRALLRRTQEAPRKPSETLKQIIGNELALNINRKYVLARGKEIPLSQLEVDILDILSDYHDEIVPMYKLRSKLPGSSSLSQQDVGRAVNSIKAKLGTLGASIEAIIGVGYRIVQD